MKEESKTEFLKRIQSKGGKNSYNNDPDKKRRLARLLAGQKVAKMTGFSDLPPEKQQAIREDIIEEELEKMSN